MSDIRLSKPIAEIKGEYDVVVIGSGYGGSIAASRMARANKRVCLLEKGKEIRPGEFPRRNLHAMREIQIDTPKKHIGKENNLFDFRVNENIHVFQGCGLGGTSLVNANVSLPPEERVFEDERWPKALRDDIDSLWEGIKRAEEILEPVTYPEGEAGYPSLPKINAQKKSAAKTGGEFKYAPINVHFKDKINRIGYEQKKCTLCGDCVTGCNHGSKNTTLMNYLPDAVNYGAEIFTEVAVSHLTRTETGKWVVHFHVMESSAEKFSNDLQFVVAGMVFLGAGCLGSTEILLRSRTKGLTLSNMLGKRFTGNGDVLAFSYNNDSKINGVGLGHRVAGKKRVGPGPCIGSVIDIRKQAKLEDGMVIEEGVIPGSLASMLPKAFISLSRLIGGDTDKGFTDFIKERWREFVSLIGGAYQGALNNTQTYLVMSHDDGQGEIYLENGRARIKWPDVGKQEIFKKVSEKLKLAATANGGNFMTSPAWNKLVNYDLVTVHPLGGCVMGDTAETGVVNHKGQVFNSDKSDEVYTNLIVCDGAVIPCSLGVNPLLTISGIAERSCKLVAEEMGWQINYSYDKPLQLKKDPAKAGLMFTECMKGYISKTSDPSHDFTKAYEKGEADNNSFEFILTINSEDIQEFLTDPAHQAQMYGTVRCNSLSLHPITVQNGVFVLFQKNPEKVNTLNMLYHMELLTLEGELYYFDGFKEMHDDPGLDIWEDTTTLYVALYKGNNENHKKQIAKGILKIKIADFMKQLSTIKIPNAKSKKEELKWIYEFNKFFTRNLFDSYNGVLQKVNLFNPDAKPRQKRPLIVSEPEYHPFLSKDGLPLLLTRFKGGDKGPVMLVHGLGVSSSIFTIDTIKPNIVEFLHKEGYDVWLIDNRISIDIPGAGKPYTSDDIAYNDYAPAIACIQEVTTRPTVHVVAHCFGSTTFSMALLNGLKGVGSLVLSQVGPHVIAHPSNVLKAKFHLPFLFDKVGIDSLTAYTDSNSSWKTKVVNYLLKFYPGDNHGFTGNAVSERISFMYGQLYEINQLNQATFDTLHELFGIAHIDCFKHLAEIIRQEKVVNAEGLDIYLPNLKKAFDIPVTFIHGQKNACFLPESTLTTYKELRKLNPDGSYRHHTIPNYGHIDCIFGRNAHLDVFPHILEHLEKHALHYV